MGGDETSLGIIGLDSIWTISFCKSSLYSALSSVFMGDNVIAV